MKSYIEGVAERGVILLVFGAFLLLILRDIRSSIKEKDGFSLFIDALFLIALAIGWVVFASPLVK